MNLVLILEQSQTNRMNRSITPSLVEETTGMIKEIKVRRVFVTAEELHITNLKVGPEMAGRVSIRIAGVVRSELVVSQPVHHIVIGEVRGIRCKELLCRRPQGWDTLGSIEQINRETISLVAILHEAEDIVIDVTKELDFGLHAPVVAIIFKRWVLVEHAAVPPAHLMVGYLIGVL
jgi:hypothetical protein